MKIKLLFITVFISQLCYGQLNWYLSNSGMPQSYQPVDFTKAPNGDVYLLCYRSQAAGDFAKLLKSSNNGTSWTEIITSGLPNMVPSAIEFSGSKLLLSAWQYTNQYVYASTDNGLTWNASNTGIPANHQLGASNFAVASNGDIFLSTYTVNNTIPTPQLVKSSNNGGSWNAVLMNGINTNGSAFALSAIGNKLFMYINNIANNPYGEIYISSDGGLNWVASSSGMPNRFEICDFAVKSNGEILAAGADVIDLVTRNLMVMSSTDNGATWDAVSNNGITSMTLATAFIYSNGELLMAGAGASTFTYYVYSTAAPVGIQELTADNTPLIYPNPAFNSLQIKNLDNKVGTLKQVDLISAKGQTIRSYHEGCDVLDIKDLDPGVYLLKISGTQKNIVARFVKSD